MDRTDIKLAIQPAYNIKTGKIFYAEILVRKFMEHDNVKDILDNAVLNNSTDFLDLSIIDYTLEYIKSNCRVPRFYLGINLCADTIKIEGIADRIHDIVLKHKIKALKLVLEISEETCFQDETVMENIALLREYGIKIALDDFGVRNANMCCLIANDIDILKVDKSIVDGIMRDDLKAIKILKCTMGICTEMGFEHVIEGIEAYEQLEKIKRLGFKHVQGFIFSKPEDFDSFKF